jgi:hypothetical protein
MIAVKFLHHQTQSWFFFSRRVVCPPTPQPANQVACTGMSAGDACEVPGAEGGGEGRCVFDKRRDDAAAYKLSCLPPVDNNCPSIVANALTTNEHVMCSIENVVSRCVEDEQAILFCRRNLQLSATVGVCFLL